MKIGDIVRHKQSMHTMTVMRLLGDEESPSFMTMDRRMERNGFNTGDPMCMWFEGTILKNGVFKSHELDTIIYKNPNATASASSGLSSGNSADEDD